ncbi:MAG: RNA methyltransferase [Candidatus Nanoarchaeia archaeon]
MINIVLMEPEHPGNLGAVARSMKNFGFSDLVVVDPKCHINSQEAKNRAKHAQEVLANIKTISKDDLKQFDYVIGTTSKVGRDYNIPRSPISPEELAEKIDFEKNIAILIGRESDGLHNDEIQRCDFVVAIPSSKEYPALNIGHATTIILYELFKKKSKELGKEAIGENITAISQAEKGQILKMVDSILDRMEFATPKDKETQQKVWKRLVGKSFMTKREAYALMGFLRKLL